MRFAACLIAALMLAAPAFAETRTINAQGFHAIDASGPYRLQFAVGETYSVSVQGAARDLDRMRISVSEGVLRISRRCTFFCGGNNGARAAITVTAPRLDRFDASMGLNASARGVEASEFSADVAMGGVLDITGACGHLSADVAMGGVLRAAEFRCRTVIIDASMGGAANVHATQSVNAEASMGGDVDVFGSPGQRNIARTMGGDVSVN